MAYPKGYEWLGTVGTLPRVIQEVGPGVSPPLGLNSARGD